MEGLEDPMHRWRDRGRWRPRGSCGEQRDKETNQKRCKNRRTETDLKRKMQRKETRHDRTETDGSRVRQAGRRDRDREKRQKWRWAKETHVRPF